MFSQNNYCNNSEKKQKPKQKCAMCEDSKPSVIILNREVPNVYIWVELVVQGPVSWSRVILHAITQSTSHS